MPSTNPFDVLNDTEDSGTACPIRQARKKLKAIEKLKNKMNKNPEEYAKIREESILRAIVEPVLTCASETHEEIEQRRTKQREKTQIKELKRKLDAQKVKYKQEILSMQRNMRILEEEHQRLNVDYQRLNEENQRLKKEKCNSKTGLPLRNWPMSCWRHPLKFVCSTFCKNRTFIELLCLNSS